MQLKGYDIHFVVLLPFCQATPTHCKQASDVSTKVRCCLPIERENYSIRANSVNACMSSIFTWWTEQLATSVQSSECAHIRTLELGVLVKSLVRHWFPIQPIAGCQDACDWPWIFGELMWARQNSTLTQWFTCRTWSDEFIGFDDSNEQCEWPSHILASSPFKWWGLKNHIPIQQPTGPIAPLTHRIPCFWEHYCANLVKI